MEKGLDSLAAQTLAKAIVREAALRERDLANAKKKEHWILDIVTDPKWDHQTCDASILPVPSWEMSGGRCEDCDVMVACTTWRHWEIVSGELMHPDAVDDRTLSLCHSCGEFICSHCNRACFGCNRYEHLCTQCRDEGETGFVELDISEGATVTYLCRACPE